MDHLLGLAEVPGLGRADLGAAGVLPGQRGLRLPRSTSGRREPDVDGPPVGPPADPAARLAAIPRRRRAPMVPRVAGRAHGIGRAHPRLGSRCCGCPGRRPSTWPQPATTPCWTSRRPICWPPQPLEPLPAGKQGSAFVPHRSSRTDSVYRHCLRAIDLVLEKRMGAHGLPLMGAGDWNDGLDEIGSQGRGESVWLGFFLYFILRRMDAIIAKKDGPGPERALCPAGRETQRRPRTHLARRPLSAGDPRRRHGNRRQRQRRLGNRRPDGRLGSHLRHPSPARADRAGHGPGRSGTREHRLARLAAADGGQQALLRPQQLLSRGGARKRHVLPRRAMARRRGADPGRAVRARRTARVRPAVIARPPIASGGKYRRWPTSRPRKSRPTAASRTSRRRTSSRPSTPGA